MSREYKQYCYVVIGQNLGTVTVTTNAAYAIEVMHGGTDNEMIQIWDQNAVVGVINRK